MMTDKEKKEYYIKLNRKIKYKYTSISESVYNAPKLTNQLNCNKPKNYYTVVVNLGHQGIGRTIETAFYVCANSIIQAMDIVKRMPAVKHCQTPILVKNISKKEFFIGRKYKCAYRNISPYQISKNTEEEFVR